MSPGSQTADQAYFEGTVEEHSALLMGCLENDGWVVTKEAAGGLGIGMDGRTDDELISAQEECLDEIGRPQYTGLTEAQLRDRYAGRIEQFNCLVDAGWLEGDPKSFEVFVEDYERSGQERLWSPARDVDRSLLAQAVTGPSQLCPVGGSGW